MKVELLDQVSHEGGEGVRGAVLIAGREEHLSVVAEGNDHGDSGHGLLVVDGVALASNSPAIPAEVDFIQPALIQVPDRLPHLELPAVLESPLLSLEPVEV